ncbi:MAG: hypothetical protein GX987_09470 [Tissierellia bacterium]|nr:hypothetical protein [Tissierellia bacterium]
MNKVLMETIKDFINDSIKGATELKETLSQIEAEDVVKRNKEITNKIRKVKKKTYAEQRAVEIANKFNIVELVDSYYKLGLAHAYGNIMYMLDEDFDKKDMKKLIMGTTKDDIQFRSDIFGVWEELTNEIK